MLRVTKQILFTADKSTIVCYVTAAKGEINDEELSHGHRKTKTEETETRKSNFEELGLRFENTSLTNTQFNRTHSPQSKSYHTSYPLQCGCMGKNR